MGKVGSIEEYFERTLMIKQKLDSGEKERGKLNIP